MASMVDTCGLGKQSLIGIASNGANCMKWEGYTVMGGVLFAYSDLPGTCAINVEYNDNILSVLPTCGRECEDCYALGMLGGCHGKAIGLSWGRHTLLMRNKMDAVEEGLDRRLCTMDSVVASGRDAIFRMYGAGDYLNADTVDMFIRLALRHPRIPFYGYTKNWFRYREHFEVLQDLPNCNVVNGLVRGLDGKLRKNFGPLPEMLELAKWTGAYICPCDLAGNNPMQRRWICMYQCRACLERQDVLFPLI